MEAAGKEEWNGGAGPAAATECPMGRNCPWRIRHFAYIKHHEQVKSLLADLARANKKLREARERIRELEGCHA